MSFLDKNAAAPTEAEAEADRRLKSKRDQTTPPYAEEGAETAKRRERMPAGTATDDIAGGDDMMAPGKSTASLPEFR